MRGLVRSFVRGNQAICRWFDRLLGEDYQTDGNRHFVDEILPAHLQSGTTIYDIGGGKHPCVSLKTKRDLALHLIGVDIDDDELKAAPAGVYDKTLCVDVAKLEGGGDGDLVVCQSLLEHVADIDGAIMGIASVLRPSGKALLFFPSRNAVFARINLLLPERIKKAILFSIFPDARKGQGFVSYYRKCTEKEMTSLLESNGLKVVVVRRYWCSGYFSFFAPLHMLWRIYQVSARGVLGGRMAETLTIVAQRQ